MKFRLFQKIAFGVSLLASASLADIFDMNGLYRLQYGPNLNMILSGNTPIVWGQWMNQGTATASFNWIEPLRDLPYGNFLPKTKNAKWNGTARGASVFPAGILNAPRWR